MTMPTRRFLACLLLLLVAPVLAPAQDFGGEEKTDSLTYHGVTANAATDPANHTMNRHPSIPGWGGCVPSSVRTAAIHAGVPAEDVERFWTLAQQKVGRGGTDPELLASMLREAMPNEKWTSYLDSDYDGMRKALDTLSAQGHVISGTMGWGQLYGPGRKIAHFVDYIHFSSADDLACVEDNNDPPGVYRWMPSGEALRRCVEGGAWIHTFARLPFVARVAVAVVLALAAAALLFLASSLLLMLFPPLQPHRV